MARNTLYLAAALLWTAIVTYFCLISSKDIPRVEIENFDKLGHFVFHFGIVFFWFLYFSVQRRNKERASLLKAFLVSVIYGSAIEFLQYNFTVTRSGDIEDVFANTIGALLGIFTIVFFLKIRKNRKSR